MATFVPSSRIVILSLALCLLTTVGAQQNPPSKVIAVRASRMLDVKSGSVVPNAVVLIQDDKITAAGTSLKIPAWTDVVDLGNATLLPGLIDCHTHLMARMSDDDPQGYGLSLLTKSQAFRALEGAADARVTLLAGFTAVRDVESEGSGYADVALRDGINQGLVDGPRMQVATRAIAAVGQYEPFGISPVSARSSEARASRRIASIHRCPRSSVSGAASRSRIGVNVPGGTFISVRTERTSEISRTTQSSSSRAIAASGTATGSGQDVRIRLYGSP